MWEMGKWGSCLITLSPVRQKLTAEAQNPITLSPYHPKTLSPYLLTTDDRLLITDN